MNIRITVAIGLLIGVILTGCAPTAASTPAQLEISTQSTLPDPEPTSLPTETPEAGLSVATDVPPTTAPVQVPQAAATSRGPNLEASDPGAYTRASGELQLVEFFAFW